MLRGRVIRLAISAGILALLLRSISAADLWMAVASAPGWIYALAVAVVVLGHLVAGLKWRLLLVDERVSTPAWIKAHFSGFATSVVAGGAVGGDLVRAAWLLPDVRRRESLAVAGVADRAIDVAVLFGLALCGLLWSGIGGRAEHVAAVAAAVLACGGVGALIVLRVAGRQRAGTLPRRLADTAAAAMRHPGPLAANVALGVTGQMVFVLTNAAIGGAVGVTAGGVGAWFVAWPLAKTATLIPLGFSGLGVREAALVTLMQPFGGEPHAVLAAGLIWEAAVFAGAIVGWAAALAIRLPHRAAAAEPTTTGAPVAIVEAEGRGV